MLARDLLVAMLSTLSFAASAQGVMTANTNSCGTYLEDRKENNKNKNAAYAIEIRAYMSGFNMGTSGRATTTMPEAAPVLAYMDKHCREHPLDDVFDGMVALTKELGGRR